VGTALGRRSLVFVGQQSVLYFLQLLCLALIDVREGQVKTCSASTMAAAMTIRANHLWSPHHVPGGVLGGRFLNQGLAGFHVTAPEVALSSHLGNFIM